MEAEEAKATEMNGAGDTAKMERKGSRAKLKTKSRSSSSSSSPFSSSSSSQLPHVGEDSIKARRKRELEKVKEENELLKGKVAHLEGKVALLEQQLHFYETIVTPTPRPSSSSSASSSPQSTSPEKGFTLPWGEIKRGSREVDRSRNTNPRRHPEDGPLALPSPCSPSSPLLTGSASPVPFPSSTPSALVLSLVSASATRAVRVEEREEVGEAFQGGIRGRSDSEGAAMTASGMGDRLTASGRRKTVGWSDAKPTSLMKSISNVDEQRDEEEEEGEEGEEERESEAVVGLEACGDGEDGGGSDPRQQSDEAFSSTGATNKDANTPQFEITSQPPPQERHHKNPLKEQEERRKKERREKAEAEFKAAQEEWAASTEHSDDELDPYPFDEPDSPANLLFKDVGQAGGHRRPSETPPLIPSSVGPATPTSSPSPSPSPGSSSVVPRPTTSPSEQFSPFTAKAGSAIVVPTRGSSSPLPAGGSGIVGYSSSTSTTASRDTRKIKGGTLHKLVERLTDHLELDPSFLRAFLLTYRSFSTPEELLELLITRWKIPRTSPKFKDTAELHFGIWFVLKTWVCDHFYDFEDNVKLIRRLQKFLYLRATKSLAAPATKLIAQLHRKMAGDEVEMETIYDEMPKSIMPRSRSFKRLSFSLNQRGSRTFLTPLSKFMDFHPLELARQLTLIESSFFRQIQPRECLNQCWNKDKANAPNILALINRFNALSGYIKVEILKTVDIKQRVKVVEYFLRVAKYCEEVHNFNALMEITSSLNASSVHRLRNTWKMVGSKFIGWKEEWDKLTLNNYVKLRDAQVQAEQPCLPYLGVFLSDLTFIEDGNKDFLMVGQHSLINFEKRRKVASVISRLQQCQRTPFGFHVVPQIYSILQQEIASVDPTEMDDNHLYQLSLQREPRDKKSSANDK